MIGSNAIVTVDKSYTGSAAVIGDGTDTLAGPDLNTAWAVNGPNSTSTLQAVGGGTITFSGFSNLTGNALDDSFKINGGGSLTGSIAGGAGNDTLNFDVLVVLSGSVAGTGYGGTADGLPFSGMNTLIGSGPADTLQGEDAVSVESGRDPNPTTTAPATAC